MDPDLEALERWRAGDRQAGNQLYGKYYDSVALFFTNAVGDTDRIDLTQETFLRLTSAVESFEGRSTFKTFLYSIARYVLADHLRKRYRGKDKFDPLLHTIQDANNVTPSRAISELGRYRALLNCLRSLPVEAKTLLELYYWHDMSAAQLAEVHGLVESSIRGRVHQARMRIIKCLADCDSADPQDLEAELRHVGQLISDGPATATSDD